MTIRSIIRMASRITIDRLHQLSLVLSCIERLEKLVGPTGEIFKKNWE